MIVNAMPPLIPFQFQSQLSGPWLSNRGIQLHCCETGLQRVHVDYAQGVYRVRAEHH